MRREKGRFSLRKKISAVFILIAGIVNIITSISLFSLYSMSQINSATTGNLEQLSQVAGSADILFQQTEQLQYGMISEGRILRCLLGKEIDRLAEADAVRALTVMMSSHPYVLNLGFYCPYTGRYLTSSGVYTDPEFLDEILFSQLSENRETHRPRMIGKSYPASSSKWPAYSFFYRPFPDTPDAILTIDIDQDYLYSLIDRIAAESKTRQILVINGDDVIIAHTDKSNFMKSARQFFFYHDLEFDTDGQHSEILRDESGKQQLVCRIRSFLSDWVFISVIPKTEILHDTVFLGIVTVILSIALFSMSFFLSLKISKQIHNPIRKLVETYSGNRNNGDFDKKSSKMIDEINLLQTSFEDITDKMYSLENTLAASMNVSRYAYTRLLLDGRIAKVSQSAAVYGKLKIPLDSPAFLPVFMELSGKNSEEDILQEYAFENLSNELLGQFGSPYFVSMGEKQFAVLLCMEQNGVPQDLEKELLRLCKIMDREFSRILICCVGESVDQWQKISASYDKAVMAFQQRNSVEQRVVLSSHDLLENSTIKQFPRGIENRFIDYIQAGNKDQVLQELGALMDFFSEIGWKYAQDYSKHLMLVLISRFSAAFETEEYGLKDAMQNVENIDTCQALDELEDSISQFVLKLTYSLEDKKRSGKNSAIEKGIEYLHDNYTDPNLSMAMVSDFVGLSRPYFGRLFAQATAMSFTEYLNNIRLSNAAKLLENPALSIEQVSKAVGIYNTNYFYTIFKKKYGATPLAYRKTAAQDTKQ